MMEFQIDVSQDGRTLWINTATSCIGRFSKTFGMDIHRSVEDQMAGQPQCLHCTHAPGTAADWLEFRRLIQQHFQIVVPTDMLTFEET